jgi:hypothetical protein
VNLGDEASAVVVVNLPFVAMAKQINPAPATIGDVVSQFLRAVPNYPPVRVRLGPGEGVCVPANGVVLDGDPTDRTDPDMLLLISDGGAR